MFENLLAQERVVGSLSDLIEHRRLPTSLLFEGPRYTGKLTAALELARSVSCRDGTAAWSCRCSSCRQQRVLQHPETKLLGTRDGMEEIAATSDVVRRLPENPAARFLFIRSVRKLLKRLDPDLWDPNQRTYKSSGGHIDEVEELLGEIQPETSDDLEPISEKRVEQIVSLAAKLEDVVPRDTIPIGQIRRLSAWAHRTTGGKAKVAILTGAERMNDSSRNALLKILEEPPPSTYFVLVTTAREAMLPTILSRLRAFSFRERTPDEAKQVLTRIFRETGDNYDSLDEYFLAWHLSPEIIRNEATTFLQAVVTDVPGSFFDDNRDLGELTGDRRVFEAFLSEVMKRAMASMSGELHGESVRHRIEAATRIERWNRIISKSLDGVRLYNMRPAGALEALFYQLRQVV